MSDVRRHVRAQDQIEAGALRNARKSLPADLRARISRLQARSTSLQASVAQLCNMPPQPPTLRGRVGALVIRIMRRSLFWLISDLQTVLEQLAGAVEDQAQALEDLVKAVEETKSRIELMAGEQKSATGEPADHRELSH